MVEFQIVKTGNTSGRIGSASVVPSNNKIILNREYVPGAAKREKPFSDFFDEGWFFDEDELSHVSSEYEAAKYLDKEIKKSRRPGKSVQPAGSPRNDYSHDNLKTMPRNKLKRMTRGLIRDFYGKN